MQTRSPLFSNEFLARLQPEFGNLPGDAAHLDMLPFRQSAEEAMRQNATYRLSAVLLLLYPVENDFHFILTERQEYNGTHSGQMSFPGGKKEPEDPDTATTALRETFEEVGIKKDRISLMGPLTNVYIPVSQFLIHPYVGYTEQQPELVQDLREVKSIYHCAVSELMKPENRIVTTVKAGNGMRLNNVPAFVFHEKIVWGATAVILNEFKQMIQRFWQTGD